MFHALVALVVAAPVQVAVAQIAFDGSEYLPNGKLLGDQSNPSVALGAGRSVMAWQENTDADGLAVKIRLLGGQFSGIAAPAYANVSTTGDQENPNCLALANGDFLVTWQSGHRGSQKIIGRILSREGVFAGPEIELSRGLGARKPKAIQSKNGTATVVWTQTGVDGDMDAVVARQISASGEVLSEPVQVNVVAEFNQRDPAIALLADGSLFIAWVTETPNGSQTATILGRRFSSNLAEVTGEIPLTSGKNPCASPALVTTASGMLLVWNEYQMDSVATGWDIYCKPIASTGGSLGTAKRATALQSSDQSDFLLASNAGKIALVFTSYLLDGSGAGIGIQELTEDGIRSESDVVANTTSLNQQVQPAISIDDNGAALVVWVGFGSALTGTDLFAQRLAKTAASLAAPNAPAAIALSSSKIRVVCTETDGLPVAKYLIYVDGAEKPAESDSPYITISGLPPASEHQFSVALQMLDGRITPKSETKSGSTWGEDENADGIPDDWQVKYFGATSASWPTPSEDPDGDGKSNRDEFLAGTNPIDSSSVLKVSLRDSQSGTAIGWNSQPGGIYQVQQSADLQIWTDLGGIHVASGSSESILVGEVPSNSYFRVNCLR